MKIGFIQFNPLFGEVDRNIEKVRGLSKPVEADLMVLPEFFNTGLSFHVQKRSGRSF